jgi:hypothetical protein
MIKGTGLLIAGALMLSACTPEDCAQKFASDPSTDPRPYQVRVGDKVVSAIYDTNIIMTVVNPMITVNSNCTIINMHITGITPMGTEDWHVVYEHVTPIETGANWR